MVTMLGGGGGILATTQDSLNDVRIKILKSKHFCYFNVNFNSMFYNKNKKTKKTHYFRTPDNLFNM